MDDKAEEGLRKHFLFINPSWVRLRYTVPSSFQDFCENARKLDRTLKTLKIQIKSNRVSLDTREKITQQLSDLMHSFLSSTSEKFEESQPKVAEKFKNTKKKLKQKLKGESKNWEGYYLDAVSFLRDLKAPIQESRNKLLENFYHSKYYERPGLLGVKKYKKRAQPSTRNYYENPRWQKKAFDKFKDKGDSEKKFYKSLDTAFKSQQLIELTLEEEKELEEEEKSNIEQVKEIIDSRSEGITAREIYDNYEEPDLNYDSISRLCRKLQRKGRVKRQKEGKNYTYYPKE